VRRGEHVGAELAITLPVGSKWKIGAKCESPQRVCFSQRSKAHMLLPSLRSTEMPNVAPQLRPAGSFAPADTDWAPHWAATNAA
jgi:hypothetical protein